VQAQLVTEVTVTPAMMTVFADAPVKHEVVVTDLRPAPLTVTSVQGSSPHLTAHLLDRGADTQGHCVQRIGLVINGDYTAGRHDEMLALYTNDPDYGELRVPVTVVKRTRPPVTLTPEMVRVTATAGRPVASQMIVLERRNDESVVIDHLDINHAAVSGRWAAGPGSRATVRITIDPAKIMDQRLETTVRVHLGGPVAEVVTIPVSYEVIGGNLRHDSAR
jgi:hypothetical protein